MGISETVVVRFAKPEDMAEVLYLIQELANYERAGNEVENSVAQLLADGFGQHPAFECLVAEENRKIIGFALFYTSYSTWKGKCLYLEDLCVTQSLRKNGVGKKLFDAVLAIAKQRDMKRLSWQVLEWNEPAISFYKKYGANLDSEWINGKIVIKP